MVIVGMSMTLMAKPCAHVAKHRKSLESWDKISVHALLGVSQTTMSSFERHP